MHSPPAATTKGQPSKSNFDKLSFVRYMKNIGRAYRKQAMELVSLCRTFVQAQEQSPGSDAKPELRIALKAVDDALGSAADVKKRPSKDVDEKFAKAIEVLGYYEKHHHPWHARSVSERLAAAKAKDKSTSTVLNVLKEMLGQKATDDKQSETTKEVEFHLFKSLPDKNPTIVRQVLGQGSNLQEVLWNFSRFKGEKRLTLRQNPHFYKDSDLPTSQKEYVGEFRSDPIEDFHHDKICVLTDKPGRVYLGSDKNTRAFGNIWVPNEAIILKDVCGKLEGESIVQASIQDASNLWYLEEPPLSPTSLPTSPNSPLSTVTTSSTYSASSGSFQDWREPIRQGLITLETDICIKAMPPSPTSPSPSSPIPSANSGVSGGGLPSMLQFPTQTTSHQISRSARATAVPRRSPVSRLSPRTPALSSPKAWFTPRLPQPLVAAVPIINQATPTSAASNTLASNDLSQRRASQGSIARGETPKVLKAPDMEGPMSLTLTITSPSGVTGPHRLHTGVSEPRSRGNTSSQADTRGPAKKGSARLAPDREATGAPPRMRGTSLSQSSVWQFWNRRCNQVS